MTQSTEVDTPETSSSENRCVVIGPFIGALSADAVHICIGFPNTDFRSLSCTITEIGGAQTTRVSKVLHEPYRVFTFEFDGLSPEGRYDYVFNSEEVTVDLNGLENKDLHFRPIGECNRGDSLFS